MYLCVHEIFPISSSFVFFCSIAYAYPSKTPQMPSPQGFPLDATYNSEDESHKVSVIKNPKEIMPILKKFSFLGILQSKINFLYTCLLLSLVPKGFSIKWSEQTGFKSAKLQESVSLALHSTSLHLQKIVLSESIATFKENFRT